MRGSKGNMRAKCRGRNKIGKYRDEMERTCRHANTYKKELVFILSYCVNINVYREEGGRVVERR